MRSKNQILVSSAGRLGLIEPDGSGERYLDFEVSGQVG